MKCDSFQEYLDGYLDGSLSELENEAMRAHMDSCGACKKIYEEQKQLLEALNDLDDGVHAPDDLVAKRMARASTRNAALRIKSPGGSQAVCRGAVPDVGLRHTALGRRYEISGSGCDRIGVQ